MAGNEPRELVVTALPQRRLVHDDEADRAALRLVGANSLGGAEIPRSYRVVARLAKVSPQESTRPLIRHHDEHAWRNGFHILAASS
jgi:hypothetical protein